MTQAKEQEELAAYTEPQRRRLSRHICMLCEHHLHHAGCGSIDSSLTCSPRVREDRRLRCLNASRNVQIRH